MTTRKTTWAKAAPAARRAQQQRLTRGLEKTKVEQPVVDLVERFGGKALKLNGIGETGWPDRLISLPGVPPFMIELKRTDGKLAPRQQRLRLELIALGWRVYVVRTAEEGLAIIRQYEQLHYLGVKPHG